MGVSSLCGWSPKNHQLHDCVVPLDHSHKPTVAMLSQRNSDWSKFLGKYCDLDSSPPWLCGVSSTPTRCDTYSNRAQPQSQMLTRATAFAPSHHPNLRMVSGTNSRWLTYSHVHHIHCYSAGTDRCSVDHLYIAHSLVSHWLPWPCSYNT